MTRSRLLARASFVSVAAGSAAVLLAVSPAAAHTGEPSGGVIDGLLHPLTGADHLLAMIAVGILAVTTARQRGPWVAPAAFLGGILVGGVAGLAGAPLPGAELLIVTSVILLGFTIAGAIEGKGDWLLVALIAAGLAHGHAHGAEAPMSANPVAYVGGFVLATVSLHALGAGVGTVIRNRRTARVGIGAATVAAGALLFV